MMRDASDEMWETAIPDLLTCPLSSNQVPHMYLKTTTISLNQKSNITLNYMWDHLEYMQNGCDSRCNHFSFWARRFGVAGIRAIGCCRNCRMAWRDWVEPCSATSKRFDSHATWEKNTVWIVTLLLMCASHQQCELPPYNIGRAPVHFIVAKKAQCSPFPSYFYKKKRCHTHCHFPSMSFLKHRTLHSVLSKETQLSLPKSSRTTIIPPVMWPVQNAKEAHTKE